MSTTQELLMDSRKALDVLDELAIIKENLSALKARESVLVDQLKQYMQLEDVEAFTDEERGITAHLQHRDGTPQYDLVNAPEHAVIMAAKAMLLKLDHAAFQRLRGNNGATWMDDLARFEMPTAGSEALIIKRER